MEDRHVKIDPLSSILDLKRLLMMTLKSEYVPILQSQSSPVISFGTVGFGLPKK
jgi:hypothetical protein